ncbi:gas vesicle accessory protein GvpU [Microcoleus sp. F10-C6]|jgi:hypothetical protein|uniref:gas vesicle accessory protein GvpU n=1 Tax=unclassified Microcoleus TaxID=2642155 RepID=UPI002FD410EC
MTQEKDNTPVTTQEKDKTPANSDLLLMSLVELAEEFSEKLSVTLFVQGSIITGLLIGEKPYLEALNDELNATTSGSAEGKEAFKAFLAPFHTLSKNSSDNQEEQSQLKDIEFIHLKNAKFCNGSSLTPQNKGVYWRGLLSRIDGFFLGNLSSDS